MIKPWDETDAATTDSTPKKPVAIDSETFYPPEYLKRQLGRWTIDHLNRFGLVTIGPWYLGKDVINSMMRAGEAKRMQRIEKEADQADERVPKGRGETRASISNKDSQSSLVRTDMTKAIIDQQIQ